MSIINCEKCDASIDSDHDPDCFVETGNMRKLSDIVVMCELCRERTYERHQEAISAEPPPSLQEQQQRAWAQKHGLKQ